MIRFQSYYGPNLASPLFPPSRITKVITLLTLTIMHFGLPGWAQASDVCMPLRHSTPSETLRYCFPPLASTVRESANQKSDIGIRLAHVLFAKNLRSRDFDWLFEWRVLLLASYRDSPSPFFSWPPESRFVQLFRSSGAKTTRNQYSANALHLKACNRSSEPKTHAFHIWLDSYVAGGRQTPESRGARRSKSNCD